MKDHLRESALDTLLDQVAEQQQTIIAQQECLDSLYEAVAGLIVKHNDLIGCVDTVRWMIDNHSKAILALAGSENEAT